MFELAYCYCAGERGKFLLSSMPVIRSAVSTLVSCSNGDFAQQNMWIVEKRVSLNGHPVTSFMPTVYSGESHTHTHTHNTHTHPCAHTELHREGEIEQCLAFFFLTTNKWLTACSLSGSVANSEVKWNFATPVWQTSWGHLTLMIWFFFIIFWDESQTFFCL